jgi:hypothetical protein
MVTELSKGKEIKIPGPDHPITIAPAEGKIRVTVAGRLVAESSRALRLEEKGHPPVYYLPRNDAEMSLPRITPIVRTRAIARTTAFPLVERDPNTPFGPTRIRIRQSPTLRSTWRFIHRGLMPSR